MNDNGRGQPILITGSQRSGTSWAGNMLCHSGEAGYIHEPFNIARLPGWAGGLFPHWFQYVCSENDSAYAPTIERILRHRYPFLGQLGRVTSRHRAGRFARDWALSLRSRLTGARPLIKDPLAVFAAEWLADRFDMRVVVMIRHPAAFAGSIKRLSWAFEFENWTEQPLLMNGYLAPYAETIRSFADRRRDLIDQAILMWNAIYHVVDGYRERRPDWIFVRHEDLARNPVSGFRDLHERLGLEWNARAARRITRDSLDTKNPKDVAWNRPGTIRRDSRATTGTWRNRLAPEEVRRVREGVAEVAARFYADGDW